MNTKLKHTGQENNARAKARFGKDATEIARLKEEITALKERVEALTKELEEVKTHSQEAAALGASVDPALSQELEALRADKANLEKALTDEQAALVVSSTQTAGLTETLVSELKGGQRLSYADADRRRSFALSTRVSLLRRLPGRRQLPLLKSLLISPPLRPNGNLNVLSWSRLAMKLRHWLM